MAQKRPTKTLIHQIRAFRVSASLRQKIEQERRRLAQQAGGDVSTAEAVRSLLTKAVA